MGDSEGKGCVSKPTCCLLRQALKKNITVDYDVENT